MQQALSGGFSAQKSIKIFKVVNFWPCLDPLLSLTSTSRVTCFGRKCLRQLDHLGLTSQTSPSILQLHS